MLWICCTTKPQQRDIHLTHSRRRIAIESRANLARDSVASRTSWMGASS